MCYYVLLSPVISIVAQLNCGKMILEITRENYLSCMLLNLAFIKIISNPIYLKSDSKSCINLIFTDHCMNTVIIKLFVGKLSVSNRGVAERRYSPLGRYFGSERLYK